MADGTKKTLHEGETYTIPPGHDAWVEGGQPFTTIELVGAENYAKPFGNEGLAPEPRRPEDMTMGKYDEIAQKLIMAGQILVNEGQDDFTRGHISFRLPDDPNLFLMKAHSLGLDEITPENLLRPSASV
eukprot:gene48211-63062_t